MYVKETYIPVRRRKRRKRFPVAMIEDDMSSSYYLFNALNADSIKKFRADQKCKPKKEEKPKKLQRTVCFDATPVDLKTMKENRKKNKKRETGRKEGVAAEKYKFWLPEVKSFSDVTFSPNTTFDRLLRSSRKPLADKNSNGVKSINSGSLSPLNCLSVDKGGNRTSTPILISPIFPAVTVHNKQRNNIRVLKGGGKNNLLTPVLRNSIGSAEESSMGLSTSLSASDSTFPSSPLLYNRDDAGVPNVRKFLESDVHHADEIESLRNKIPRINSTIAGTHAQDSSEKFSAIKMRLRRTTAIENEGGNNIDNLSNPDESFFSSVKVHHKRNRRTGNHSNKVNNTQSSDDFVSPIFTGYKRTSEIEVINRTTMGALDHVRYSFPQFEIRSLTHSMSVYYEENAEKSHCNRSRRSSLCRRLSHVIVPERRTRSNNSNISLPKSDKCPVPLSVSVIIEDDELVPEVDIIWTEEVSSARDMVLARCNQSRPFTFEKAFPARFFDNCKKIGEGLYGEVFFCQYNGTPGKILKIIPIEGHILVNGEKQKKFNEVLSELVIAMELSNLRHDAQFRTSCFVEVARCVCVQGKYPQRLIDLWNDYHNEKVSENDSPTIFDDNQIFLIFELADGGKPLETYCFTSAAQAFSAFIQLTFALAVAEVTLEFEHRDLHWGNVLINKTSAKHVTFRLNGKEYLIPTNGIQVTVIDYTLSRMSYSGCCIYNNLAVDPDLFNSQGDYQFEVYRLMQNTVKNEWNHFRPYTNILWLHYTLGKMLLGVHYKNVSTKTHKKFKTKLTSCFNDVLKYNSAYELLTSGKLLETMK